MFYQPLFRYPALPLYLNLYQLSHHKINKKVIPTLLTNLHVDRETLSLLKNELEEFKLITVLNNDKNDYIIIINKPLSSTDFLSHHTFGRLLKINIIPSDYDSLYESYSPPSFEEYKDITNTFNVKRLSAWNETMEDNFKEVLNINPNFDIEAFFSSVSLNFVPLSIRSPRMKQIVNELGSQYNIGFQQMRSYLYKNVNTITGEFYADRFVKDIEKDYQNFVPKNVENPYTLGPLTFLKYLVGDKVYEADKRLVQYLMKEIQLPNEVINVLLEYVWNTNNFDLNKAFVERIAITWKRRNIDTIDKALKQISEVNTKTSLKTKEIAQPQYDTETSQEVDESKLEALLEKWEGKL